MESGRRFKAFVLARFPDSADSRAQFAKAVGVTPSAVSAWFAGTYEPDLRSLGKIAEVLGCTRAEIMVVLDGDGT